MAKCFSVKRIAIAAVLCRNVHHIRRQSGAKYKEHSAPTLSYEMLEYKLQASLYLMNILVIGQEVLAQTVISVVDHHLNETIEAVVQT